MIQRRPRRAMNQINVVPYIDVMLVLLVIFMVTAPFMNPSQVELPSVGKSSQAPVAPLEVTILANGTLMLRDRVEAGEGSRVRPAALAAEVIRLQKGNPDRPVVISADKSVRYAAVMQVMDTLQRNNVARIGLLVKPVQP